MNEKYYILQIKLYYFITYLKLSEIEENDFGITLWLLLNI